VLCRKNKDPTNLRKVGEYLLTSDIPEGLNRRYYIHLWTLRYWESECHEQYHVLLSCGLSKVTAKKVSVERTK